MLERYFMIAACGSGPGRRCAGRGVVMPFTYSITISWLVLHVVTGRARGIHPLMWALAVLFVGYFAQAPIQALVNIS